jgi:hypothetical protein
MQPWNESSPIGEYRSVDPVFISFYTKKYERFVKDWCDDMHRFRLRHCVAYRDLNTRWQLICYYKPSFILEMMERFRQPVVWVDIDARIRQRPDLILHMPPEVDFGYCLTTSSLQNLKVLRDGYGKVKIVTGGTIYLSASEAALELVRRWVELCKHRDYYSDQQVLTEVFGEYRPEGLVAMEMPQHQYCCCRRNRHAVIEHLIASTKERDYKSRTKRRYSGKHGPAPP